MDVDTVAGNLSNEANRVHERPEESVIGGGEAKRLRECDEDKDSGVGHGEESMDDDDDDDWTSETKFLDYRQDWIRWYGGTRSFEDETGIKARMLTDGPLLPLTAWPRDMLQIFSVKVTEIMGGLQWPLDVYGHIAVRDSLDRKRNYLFRRDRNDCQTLASANDCLKLTGPSRAIVLIDPVVFEVDLKVKTDNGTSFKCEEDKVLSLNVFSYNHIFHMDSFDVVRRVVEPTEHSTMEFVAAHLSGAVEATIEVKVVKGSADFMARFIARTDGIDEDFVLLDSQDRKVEVDDHGLVRIQRCVIAVPEVNKENKVGFLSFKVEAHQGGDGESVVKEVRFIPRIALRSQVVMGLGFCELSVEVAWSLLV